MNVTWFNKAAISALKKVGNWPAGGSSSTMQGSLIRMHKLLIGLIVSVIAAGNCTAQEKSLYCTHFGGMAEKVCPVSMVALTLSHQSFLRKSVAVSGYVGKVDGSFYLFTTSEFYRDRSMADSVLLKGHEDRMSKYIGKRITVIGRVSSINDYDDDIFRPFARVDVQQIR